MISLKPCMLHETGAKKCFRNFQISEFQFWDPFLTKRSTERDGKLMPDNFYCNYDIELLHDPALPGCNEAWRAF